MAILSGKIPQKVIVLAEPIVSACTSGAGDDQIEAATDSALAQLDPGEREQLATFLNQQAVNANGQEKQAFDHAYKRVVLQSSPD
jgi:hypothetical protein